LPLPHFVVTLICLVTLPVEFTLLVPHVDWVTLNIWTPIVGEFVPTYTHFTHTGCCYRLVPLDYTPLVVPWLHTYGYTVASYTFVGLPTRFAPHTAPRCPTHGYTPRLPLQHTHAFYTHVTFLVRLVAGLPTHTLRLYMDYIHTYAVCTLWVGWLVVPHTVDWTPLPLGPLDLRLPLRYPTLLRFEFGALLLGSHTHRLVAHTHTHTHLWTTHLWVVHGWLHTRYIHMHTPLHTHTHTRLPPHLVPTPMPLPRLVVRTDYTRCYGYSYFTLLPYRTL